jgi:hypothetical protein
LLSGARTNTVSELPVGPIKNLVDYSEYIDATRLQYGQDPRARIHLGAARFVRS